MNNLYYYLRNCKNIPARILTDANTICFETLFPLNFITGAHQIRRVYPTDLKDNYFLFASVVLVNPTPEDLTYLALLDIKCTIEIRPNAIASLDSLLTIGIASIDIDIS